MRGRQERRAGCRDAVVEWPGPTSPAETLPALAVPGPLDALRRDAPRTALLTDFDGTLSPVVDRVYPLADAAEAHRRLESRQAFGKIVLEP